MSADKEFYIATINLFSVRRGERRNLATRHFFGVIFNIVFFWFVYDFFYTLYEDIVNIRIGRGTIRHLSSAMLRMSYVNCHTHARVIYFP